MELIFATHNAHKLKEVQEMLPHQQLLSLDDISFNEEIEETGKSFEANARIKSETVFRTSKIAVFSDDSGLVVEALDGAPGIYSARYSDSGTDSDNVQKLLKELEGKTNRKAYFICVICLINTSHETYFFEGKIHGSIATKIMGENGFGYDPIFIPEKHDCSFAQMQAEEKNTLSHRAIAIKQLNTFLTNQK